MDRGARRATAHGIAESDTTERLTHTFRVITMGQTLDRHFPYITSFHPHSNPPRGKDQSPPFTGCTGSEWILSVQLLSCVRLFVTPWTAAHQASLSIINSRSLLKLMSIELMMPSNHLILCRPLLFLPSIFPSIKVFFNESVLSIRWPKYWEFQLQHQSFQ